MENFKYIKNISEDEGTILLYNQIGDSVDANGNYVSGISGNMFAYEMQYLQDKCKKINVRINSIGGSVLDGYSIVSAILNCKVPVDTYIDGLAASISGVIAMCGKKVKMADYGTLMLHNPSGVEDTAVLDIVKNTLVTILSKRTSKSDDDISNMMNAETWLNASQCMNMGIVDEVVSSQKKISMPKVSNLADMVLIYNKIINPKKQTMEKVFNLLNLKNEATEMEVVDAIEAKDDKNATLEKENEELKARLKAIEDKENEAKELALNELKEKATALVETAITEKKIEETEKEATIEMAVNNFDLVVNMLSKISNVKDAVKVFDIKNVATPNGEDRSNWTIRDYEKKDPKALAEIKNSTPAIYEEMKNKFYNAK